MPHNEFKREPETARLARVWQENKGNWLVATGLVVSLLAWAVGYFDLIPHISAGPSKNSSASLMATGHTLIVRVTGCESDQGQVVAMLYAGETFGESATALRVELLKIRDQTAVWHNHNLPFGSYAVVAFHDVNSDEMLQPGVERQGPLTRLGPHADDEPLTYSDMIFQFAHDQQKVAIELR